jgi:hypothetical protein
MPNDAAADLVEVPAEAVNVTPDLAASCQPPSPRFSAPFHQQRLPQTLGCIGAPDAGRSRITGAELDAGPIIYIVPTADLLVSLGQQLIRNVRLGGNQPGAGRSGSLTQPRCTRLTGLRSSADEADSRETSGRIWDSYPLTLAFCRW